MQAARTLSTALGALAIAAFLTSERGMAHADEKDHVLQLSGGKLQLTVDKQWKQFEPRVRIIQYEFKVPAAKDDATPGRVTIMHAGGSIEQNIDRWIAQFTLPAGTEPKVEKKKFAGLDVHLVDISGTFKQRSGGPLTPAVDRPDHRMLAAIIETPARGNYFVKFTGDKRTVAANEKPFLAMFESLKWK